MLPADHPPVCSVLLPVARGLVTTQWWRGLRLMMQSMVQWGGKGLLVCWLMQRPKLPASVFKDTCWYYDDHRKSRPSSISLYLTKLFVPISDRFLCTTLQQLVTTYSIKSHILSLTSKVLHDLSFMLLLASRASPIPVSQPYWAPITPQPHLCIIVFFLSPCISSWGPLGLEGLV